MLDFFNLVLFSMFSVKTLLFWSLDIFFMFFFLKAQENCASLYIKKKRLKGP
jgi:hypothetical protein